MKTLRSIHWRAMWASLRIMLMCVGAVALVAWLPNQPAWLIAFAAMWIAALWYAIYSLCAAAARWQPKYTAVDPSKPELSAGVDLQGAIHNHRRTRVARAYRGGGVLSEKRASVADSSGVMKKRFVYHDVNTGEDVFKYELAN